MLPSALNSGTSCCVAVDDRLISYWENFRAGKMRIAFRGHFLFIIQTHLCSKALSYIRQKDAAFGLKRWGTLQQFGKATRWRYAVSMLLSKRVFVACQLRRFALKNKQTVALKKKERVSRFGQCQRSLINYEKLSVSPIFKLFILAITCFVSKTSNKKKLLWMWTLSIFETTKTMNKAFHFFISCARYSRPLITCDILSHIEAVSAAAAPDKLKTSLTLSEKGRMHRRLPEWKLMHKGNPIAALPAHALKHFPSLSHVPLLLRQNQS